MPGNHQEYKIKLIIAKPSGHSHKLRVMRSICAQTQLAQNKFCELTTLLWTAVGLHSPSLQLLGIRFSTRRQKSCVTWSHIQENLL